MESITASSLGAVIGKQVSAVLTGADQFSSLIEMDGQFNFSVVPLLEENQIALMAFVGKVTLQRAFTDVLNKTPEEIRTFIPDGEVVIWNTVSEHTVATELVDIQPTGGLFRVGIILPADYTQGKVLVRLGR